MAATASEHIAGAWLAVLRRYFVVLMVAMLAWEFAQLPLYTLWYQETWGKIIFAAVHCTGGDLLIAASALLVALLLFANKRWPETSFARVAIIASLGGLAFTVFSEWLNTEIRGTWTYAVSMPTLPLIGTGLSPLVQWIIVPPLALWWARQPTVRGSAASKEKAV